MSKELDNIPSATLSNYIGYLERANLIYISYPVSLDGKQILKAKPKIYIADAAIRSAVLMLDNVLFEPEEMGIMVETTVYKHLVSYYNRVRAKIGYYRKTGGTQKEVDAVVELPQGKVLFEVKYRENPVIKESDAIIEMSKNSSEVVGSFIITKKAEDYGKLPVDAKVPVMRIPAFAFLYILGYLEKIKFACN